MPVTLAVAAAPLAAAGAATALDAAGSGFP
jgi:hypothetical protein